MEELVHHRHYNSALQADSYVHMANALERRNWLMAPLYYSMKQLMTEVAYIVAQMTALVVVLAWVIEYSEMEALQMLSRCHSLADHIQTAKG